MNESDAVLRRAAAILHDPSRYTPLLYALYQTDLDGGIADWLAKSLGDESELLVKRLLVRGFTETHTQDLIGYARRMLLEEIRGEPEEGNPAARVTH